MIPQQTLENYPVFGDTATKVAPDDAKYSAGFQQSDVLPAEWMNWAWNKNTKGITDLNLGIASIEKELIAILTDAGITPALATENQIDTAINQLITNRTGNIANLTTTDKTSLTAATNEVKSQINTHSALTGTNAHGGTTAADSNQIVVRDSNGKAYGKTSATSANPTLSKTDELANFTTLYNALFPVGFVYTQYPGQKSPSDLKMPGTWTEIKFGGAFFRSQGTNAKTWADRTGVGLAFAATATAGSTTLTFSGTTAATLPLATELTAGDIIIYDGTSVTVSAIASTTTISSTSYVKSVTLSAKLSSSAINSTVIVGQADALQTHKHYVYKSVSDSTSWGVPTMSAYRSASYTADGYTNEAYDCRSSTDETRAKNITIKIWKRTA